MRRSHVTAVLAASVALVLLVGGVAQSVVEIEAVVTGKGTQYRGFANDAYVVYTDWSPKTGISTAVARSLADGTETKLNVDGTAGNAGAIDPGTDRVIYQQWTRRNSALFFYDLDTGERTKVAGVNSRDWEWDPMISSSFILYGLDQYRDGRWITSLEVYDRAAGETRTLGTWRNPYVYPGSVGDRYVTYTLCDLHYENCSAYLYDLETAAKQRIPTVKDRPQYAPVVDEANSTVYFTRSAFGCGKNVAIWRRPVPISDGDAVTKIVDLPDGIDAGWEASLTPNSSTGQMDLYFERWNCTKKAGDVYVARGVDPIATP